MSRIVDIFGGEYFRDQLSTAIFASQKYKAVFFYLEILILRFAHNSFILQPHLNVTEK